MVRNTILKSLAPAAVALLSVGGAFAQDTAQPGGQPNQPVYQQPGQPGQYQPPTQRQQGAQQQQGQQGAQQRQPTMQPGQQRQQQGMQQGAKQTGAAQDASIQALQQLHAINQVESALALGGINQAQDPDVQRFARMLAKEHQESDLELMQTARKLNIDVAPSSDSDQVKEQLEQQTQQMRQQLQEAQGEQFDRLFVRAMVQTHESALQQMGGFSTAVQDPQVSKLIQTRIKTMQKHLDKAQQLQDQLMGSQGQRTIQGQQGQQGQQRTTPQQTSPGQRQGTMPSAPQNAPGPQTR